jgi:hypothetical protein
MSPRRDVPPSTAPWAALVLILTAQCNGGVSTIPDEPGPGVSEPGGATPGTRPPSSTPPGVTPPAPTPPGSNNPPVPPAPTSPTPTPTPNPTPTPTTPPVVVTPPGPAPTPAGPPGPFARGVRIGLVEAAQGVFVKLGDDEGVVAPAMRNAPLIEGRPFMARVHVTTNAGFTARRLRAVLSLGYSDQTKFEIEESKMIAGASNAQRLETTFNFLVPAANVKPNTTFAASVFETGEPMGPEPATLPRFPATGSADLGIKAGKMELAIVVVPEAGLMDSPERRAKIEKDLYDLYPVQRVVLRFHAPVPAIADGFSSTKGFAMLRTLRERENAKPWEYYHFVTRGPANFAGVSSLANETPGGASRRTSITIVRNGAIDGNTNTMAHETGHASGSSHMPGCGAARPDAMFPYSMPGDAGVNGYSLMFNAFKSRMMFRDLMSYCRPRWISDYVWKKFETRVRVVSGFEGSSGAMADMMASRSLLGYAGPGEDADWGIVAGRLVDETATITPTRYARLELIDGRQVMAPVAVNLLSDEETREFSVNLDGADYFDADILQAEVVIDGQRSMVPVGSFYRR